MHALSLRHLYRLHLIPVKAQLIDAQHAMPTLQIADDAPVVDHAPIVRAGDIDVADMPRAVRQIGGFKNHPALGRNSERVIGMAGTGHAFIAA